MPGAYFQLVRRQLGVGDRNAGFADIPERNRTTDDVVGEISVTQQLGQVAKLNRSQPPGWGLRVGSLFDVAAHGTVGVAAATAATVADAVMVFGRYGMLRTPFLTVGAHRGNGGLYLAIDDAWGIPSELLIPLLECSSVSITRLLSRLTGRRRDQLRVQFSYPPPEYKDLYRKHLPMHTTFGGHQTRIEVPGDWLAIRPPTADSELHRATLKLLSNAAVPTLSHHAVAYNVERIVSSSAGPMPISAVANRLNTTPRTLERQLRKSGTTYRQVVERHTREQADQLLRYTSLPVALIAERLGYSDAANFGRACRRWFNASPRDHRLTGTQPGAGRPIPD